MGCGFFYGVFRVTINDRNRLSRDHAYGGNGEGGSRRTRGEWELRWGCKNVNGHRLNMKRAVGRWLVHVCIFMNRAL